MNFYPKFHAQEGIETPKYFCKDHGVAMIINAIESFNIVTGVKTITAFESKCPRWFCGFTILTGVVSPRPVGAPGATR